MIDPADESSRLAALVAQKKAEPAPASHTLGRTASDAFWVYRWLKLSLTGVLLIGLGFAMVFAPPLRDNPRTISLPDVVRGSCTGVIGLLIIGLVFFFIRRGKSQAPKGE
jgi:hypothetical protein